MGGVRRALRGAWTLLPRQLDFVRFNQQPTATPAPRRSPTERVRLLEETLEEYLDTLGPWHHRTIAARNNLAAAYVQRGRNADAAAEFERALADCRQVLGEGTQQTDVIAENLAYCYEDATRWDDAAALWEKLVQYRTSRLGTTAQETVTARTGLAHAYRRTGQVDAAVAHAERAVDDAESADGARVEQLRIGLARAYRDAGQLDAGIRQLRMVYARRRQRLGSAHADTLGLRHRLGRWQHKAGHSEEAASTLHGAYRVALSASGDPEIRLITLRLRRDLARTHRELGRDLGDLR